MLEKNSKVAIFTKKCNFPNYGRIAYLAMALIALIIYVLQKQGIVLPALINNYVNDLLCLPLVLGAITFAIRRLKKDPLFTLSIVFIIVMTCFYAFYFEYYLPQINSRYTADWIDVSLYFSGGIAYYCCEKRFTLHMKRQS